MSEAFVADRLMWGQENITETDVRYYNVKEEPFRVYGLYQYKTESEFKRMPDEVAERVSRGVVSLYRNTAGGRVRFATDSDYIIVRAHMPKVQHFDHMPLTGTSGFDLYEDCPDSGESFFVGLFRPPVKMTDGFVAVIHLHKERKLRYFTLNFPLYNDVSSLEIGVREDAVLGEGMPYRNRKPIVFYGSSITQGGCASRPGNCYISLVCRRMNLDYINLGFSGSGKAEEAMVDYLADLDMSCFVSDYDHNAPNAEYLRKTHAAMYQKIRRKNPDIPYVMISRPDFAGYGRHEEASARRDVVMDTFRYARAQGDTLVRYLDGESFFSGTYRDACTVDTTHPNDLGFMYMAEKVFSVLREFSFE